MGNESSSNAYNKQPLKTTLFEKESSGITYRIPSLIYLKETRGFFAFAEKRSSPSDCEAKILVMRRGSFHDDGSIQWSPSQELSTACLPEHRTMNPCPVYERISKTLFLFFICVLGNSPEHRQIVTGKNQARLCYVTSQDEGQSWSQTKDLTDIVIGKSVKRWATFAVGPGHGIQLQNGRLIIPAYVYYISFRCCYLPVPYTVQPYALSIYSDDFGQTWQAGKMLQRMSCECEMAEIIDREGRSHLYCNARNKRGHRVEALSESGGFYFDKPRLAQQLIEPRHGCQGSVVGFPAPEFASNNKIAGCVGDATSTFSTDSQTWLLYTHPTHRSKRRDLGVYLNRSPLLSSGWDQPWILHRGPSGYSDLAYTDNMTHFGCLMECGKDSELEQIAFALFTLGDVMQAMDKTGENNV